MRVRAALRAAARRAAGPLVRTALRAVAERSEALRRPAAVCACRASDAGEAALCPSRRSALVIARERRLDVLRGLRIPWPTS